MTYEYYSSLALVSSVVVYALAMFAHAAEWAAARRLGVANPAVRELVDVAAADGRPGSSELPPERSDMRPDAVEGRGQPDPVSSAESSPASRRRVE